MGKSHRGRIRAHSNLVRVKSQKGKIGRFFDALRPLCYDFEPMGYWAIHERTTVQRHKAILIFDPSFLLGV
jgi:hypothetical protein